MNYLGILLFTLIMAGCSKSTVPHQIAYEINPEAQVLSELLTAELAIYQKQYRLAADNYLDIAYRKNSPESAERAMQIAITDNNLNTAMQAARLWVKLAPQDALSYFSLSAITLDMGYPNLAAASIQKALAFKPQWKEAIALRNRISLVQHQSMVLNDTGWLQFRLENYQSAIDSLAKAWQINKDGRVAARLGTVLWIVGDQKNASFVWEEGLKNNPHNQALINTIKQFKP